MFIPLVMKAFFDKIINVNIFFFKNMIPKTSLKKKKNKTNYIFILSKHYLDSLYIFEC